MSLQKQECEYIKNNWQNNFSRAGSARVQHGIYENICPMKPENKGFLEDNRHHWHTLRDAQYLRHLDGNTRSEMQRIMGEEFRPGYTADLWCPPCVSEMLSSLYREFEKWEAAQAATLPPIGINVVGSDAIPDNTLLVVGSNGEATLFDLSGNPLPPQDPVAPAEEPVINEPEPPSPVAAIQTKANFPSHKKHQRR
jgi:hypothetical protein